MTKTQMKLQAVEGEIYAYNRVLRDLAETFNRDRVTTAAAYYLEMCGKVGERRQAARAQARELEERAGKQPRMNPARAQARELEGTILRSLGWSAG